MRRHDDGDPVRGSEKTAKPHGAVEDYHRRADGKAHVDYAFHLIVTDPSERILRDELPALIREGYTSFKLYMTYGDVKLDDGQILDVLALAREHGAMAMVHAENAGCIARLTRRLEAAGRVAPRLHADSRPMAVEGEATHRAIALAQVVDVPILIVHISGREAVEQICWRADAAYAFTPRLVRSISCSPQPRWGSKATKAPSASAARRRAANQQVI